MPYRVEWFQEGRIVYEKFSGNVTLDDIHGLNTEALALVASGIYPVHVLADLSHVLKYPTSLAAIKAILKAPNYPDTLGWVILYGANNPLLRLTASIATQYSSKQFRLVNTLEQALDFLREQDKTLKFIIRDDRVIPSG